MRPSSADRLLVRDELFAAPGSSLNLPIGATRRIATVHVELEPLQKVRSALGGKVNDVVLCVATGALRELLLARGEDPPRQGLRAGAVTGLTELAPPVLHAKVRAMSAQRLFDVTITNVPGPPRRLYAFGAPMIDIVPIVPLVAEHALGIAAVSYAGGVTFGPYADRATAPDLDVLGDGVVTSVREMGALAHPTAAAR